MSALTYWQRKQRAMRYGKPHVRPQDADGMREFLRLRRRKNFNFGAGPITDEAYKINVNRWIPPRHEVPQPFNKQTRFGNDNLTFVNNDQTFEIMMGSLVDVNVFALDLEFHDDHSYLGMTALIQIATHDQDFIVDPFECYQLIVTNLKPILESPSIIKVLHGCGNDVRNLQRDFGIKIMAVIDMQLFFQVVRGGNVLKYDNLAKHFYSRNELSYLSDTQKHVLSVADFRTRPMADKVLLYARADVHLLIRIYFILYLETSEEQYYEAATKSNEVLLKKGHQYITPTPRGVRIAVDAAQLRAYYRLNDAKKDLFERLYAYREDMALRLDEKPEFIIKLNHLFESVDSSLNDEHLKALVQGYSESTEMWIMNFIKILHGGQEAHQKLLSTSCHNCFESGHCAWGCTQDYSKENGKRYFSLHPESKTQVNRRRRQNKAANRKAREEVDAQNNNYNYL